MRISTIYSYSYLFKLGREKGKTPPSLSLVPQGARLSPGFILHSMDGSHQPLGYCETLPRRFYDSTGQCIGRISRPSGNVRKREPNNQVGLQEEIGINSLRNTYLVDEEGNKIAFFTNTLDRVRLAINGSGSVIAILTGNNPAGL